LLPMDSNRAEHNYNVYNKIIYEQTKHTERLSGRLQILK